MKFIDLATQYQTYKSEIDASIHAVLDSAHYIMGEPVKQLEQELQLYTQAKHAIGCSSGTDALVLALMALDIKANDEVITTPFTFFATSEAIAFVGAKPVFVDIDEKTFNIDNTKIEEKITPQTKAIMPVSLFGQPANMDPINAIAQQHKLHVIEDAAQSFGASYKHKKSTNLSHIGCTSFFPAKVLGGYGDGGAVFTNDDSIATKIRALIVHGQSQPKVYKYIGMSGRLDTIQAAVLRIKLQHLDDELNTRTAVAETYNDGLNNNPNIITPTIETHRTSVYVQYAIKIKTDRGKIIEQLKKRGIPTTIHYDTPLHLQEAFNYLGYKVGDFPVAELTCKQILCLPMCAFLTHQNQELIINTLNISRQN